MPRVATAADCGPTLPSGPLLFAEKTADDAPDDRAVSSAIYHLPVTGRTAELEGARRLFAEDC
jgi:hypothetical protein